MKNNKIITAILIIVLALNVALLTKIDHLNNQVRSLNQNYNYLQSNLNSISGNVSQTLERFTREQSWIAPVQVDPEKTTLEDGHGRAVLNWQIKDYQENAKVYFHYSKSESGNFKTILAESSGDGYFEVSIPLDFVAEPRWEIQASNIEERGLPQKAIEERKPIDHNIRHYVSMKTSDVTKSSEISYLNLAYLAYGQYEPVMGHVTFDKNRCDIALFKDLQESNHFETLYESVIAGFYNGSSLIAQKPVEIANEPNGVKNLTFDAGDQEVTRLILQVRYSDGKTFEKEISQ